MTTKPRWQIIRDGQFEFRWFPRVTLGVYRGYYNGWMLTINPGLCSLSWYE